MGVVAWRGGQLRGGLSDSDAKQQVLAYEDAILLIWRRHSIIPSSLMPVGGNVPLNVDGTYY